MKTEGLSFSEALDLLELESQRIKIKDSDWVVGIKKGKYPIDFPATENIDGINSKHFEFTDEGCDFLYPDIFWQGTSGILYFGPITSQHLLSHDWELVK